MLKTVNLEEELDRFFKELIKQSRANLTRGKNNASKTLYNEMNYSVEVNKNSFSASFNLPVGQGQNVPYGEYLDKGVKGIESGRSLANYKYTNKKPPISAIKRYMKTKPIKARSRETGRFIKQEQGAYMIQNAIYKKGIKPTEFFSKPFKRLFKRLPDEIVKKYGLDVDDFIQFIIK